MSLKNRDIRVRPGRIGNRERSQGAGSFVGQVLHAAKKAGHTGHYFGGARRRATGSSSGRGGRFAAAAGALSRRQRRVIVKARVVRHQGTRYRSTSLAKYIAYLKREGMQHGGRDAAMFDRTSDTADAGAFAERCEHDRHHFRFTISPEDAAELEDLRAFARDLMASAERDVGTPLDWIAVDHWDTDNPHLHVLVRGRTDEGGDLVIARDYISHGLRARAEELVGLELGPRSDREIAASLEADVTAERWTGIDSALRALADDHAGVADLRPGSPEPDDPELRRLMIGRAQTLERLGLAEKLMPAVWSLKSGAEATLRELALRGDIIKTMHRAMAGGADRPAGDFAIEGMPVEPVEPVEPVLGRLVERGLHDELGGTAYAVVDGVDGRVHHLRFPDLEATGDTPVEGIVETRIWTPLGGGKPRLLLIGRSDHSLEAQVSSDGATWLDRLRLARDRAALGTAGFGGEVRAALERRVDHLQGAGLARRSGQRVVFARDLLATLRTRELGAAAARLEHETGLASRRPARGETVAGIYRQRLDLASGRIAMIDDGRGFALVPWTPLLERHLGANVTGSVKDGGGIAWSLGRKRGLAI